MTHPEGLNGPCGRSHKAPSPIDISGIEAAIENAKNEVENAKSFANQAASDIITGCSVTDSVKIGITVAKNVTSQLDSTINVIGNLKAKAKEGIDGIQSQVNAAAVRLNQKDAKSIRLHNEQNRLIH